MDEDYEDELVGDDDVDGDDPPKKKKRIATSTKVILVIAGWLLLTLFLVGEFSKDKNETDIRAQLESANDFYDDGGTPDVVDTEDEEAADLDGDGFITEEERAAALEGLSSAGEDGSSSEAAAGEDGSGSDGGGDAGSGSGGGGVYPGQPADGETAPTAVPGTAPGGGPTTTTTAAGGGGGGGGGGGNATTTTTAKPGGGGGGGATTTSSPTTSAPPPPPPTTEQPGDPVTLDVTASGLAYHYPEGYSSTLVLPRGSKIRFDNTEGNNGTSHSFTVLNGWNSGQIKANDGTRTMPDGLTVGTYQFRCTVHASMNGTITVT